MITLDAVWTPDVQQKNFRNLLEAMSRPGTIHPIISDHEGKVPVAILATLLDAQVSLCDQDHILENKDWPLLQAKKAPADSADYVLCVGAQASEIKPKIGTLTSPEFSATLIIKVKSLTGEALRFSLNGPGVEKTRTCTLDGLDPYWLKLREACGADFPMGVDIILFDKDRVMALPRTTKVEIC